MSKTLTTEEFIRRSNIIHDNKYDYSLVVYVNSKTLVIIICPIHGIFEQLPNSHLLGHGCSNCGFEVYRPYMKEETFIKKANIIHKNKYFYFRTKYTTAHDKLIVICSTHGSFEQRANDHLNGKGCSECALLTNSKKHRKHTTESFITEANIIHNNFYIYALVDYISCDKKVPIICPIHGEFPQTPYKHLSGQGCPSCAKGKNISKPQLELQNFITSIYNGEILTNVRIKDIISNKI